MCISAIETRLLDFQNRRTAAQIGSLELTGENETIGSLEDFRALADA
jgi:hypothetical protein